jgi:hypothetical protein
LWKILKTAVVTMALKTHHDEKFLPVLVFWHQILQTEQSTHHRVHEVVQDRLGIFDSTWLTFICRNVLWKILKMAVVTMALKTHHDEKLLPVLGFWHQISQTEQSIHHRVHEVAQDRLGIFMDDIYLSKILKMAVVIFNWVACTCWVLYSKYF